MTATVIINIRRAPCKCVWLRDRLLFILSWSLWGTMLLHLMHGVWQEEPVMVDWLLHNASTVARWLVIAAVFFCVFLLIFIVPSICYRALRPQLQHSCALRLDVVSTYFGLDPELLQEMQLEKRVVIHHTNEGHIADIKAARVNS